MGWVILRNMLDRINKKVLDRYKKGLKMKGLVNGWLWIAEIVDKAEGTLMD
ncbi:hypothetical protein PVK06_042314 [Gossypium arboreum]|uniref:Uncharacterized protein n=1 Tax=Gossypium arboreum TaxID=29729 RepID=A0ABR0MKE2_GOSAR|nr:hypothetical protein PVK06_042314 [Gossypium arboreum]